MTNPPRRDDPQWSRPADGVSPSAPQPQQPTERIQRAPGAEARPTERIPRQPADPPTQQISTPPTAQATEQLPRQSAPQGAAAPEQARAKRGFVSFIKDPLSIILVCVIIIALVIAGLLGGELFARSRANSIVSQVVSCVVQDKADASFSVVPPFLWQHVNRHYSHISIETEGNQIRDAKGMKLNLNLGDVRLTGSDGSGTIGSMIATIDWSADGIKRSVQDAVPLIGGFLTNVRTDSSAGTIELDAGLGSVVAKPQVVDNEFKLEVVSLTGLGFAWPREAVQPALDTFTSQLTKGYPMEIRADSVEVTDTGVTAKFSSQNSTIPPGTEDPCFAGL